MAMCLACSNQKETTEATAFQTMMDLQEKVRPMIADVNRLSNQLEQLETKVDSADRQLLGEIDLSIRALEKADQGMMAWINVNGGNQLELLRTDKSHKEIMQYIEAEQMNLVKVQGLMKSSIAQAEKVINTAQE